MDFKSLRSDKLKLTQEEFANLYGISIQEVQELDKTGKPDMDLIVKIATKSGLDFNTILSYEKPRVKPISATASSSAKPAYLPLRLFPLQCHGFPLYQAHRTYCVGPQYSVYFLRTMQRFLKNAMP